MKILFISPGSGDGYFCGNCYRDNLMAQALHRAGHEVTVVPLYLPLEFLGELQGKAPVFFPAATFYVEQKMRKRIPHWVRRMLDSKASLRLAASFSGTTSAAGMEQMTLSMIEGDDSAFKRHVEELVSWVKDIQPQVIHLSSTLLLAVAKPLKEALGLPFVCSLQDEEVWIDSLAPEYAQRAWQSINNGAEWIDKFVTTSYYYQQIARKRMPDIEPPTVIYPGVEISRYASDESPECPTIGFFYRMNELDGLDILAEAFVLLKKRNTIPHLKLRIGGGYMPTEKKFLARVHKTLHPYAEDVYIEKDYTWRSHFEFYRHITVLSVPLRFPEGIGLYLCEAFAAGRPAVEPHSGSFSEIIGRAGLTYEPNSPEALADALEQLLTNPARLAECASEAAELSRTRYNDSLSVNQLLTLYEKII